MWIGRAVVLIEFVAGAAMIGSAPHANGTQVWVFGIGIVLLCFAILTLGLAFPSWRSTRVTPTDIQIPSGLSSRKVISLSSIAGTGLLFHPAMRGTRSPMAWMTFIWDDSGGRYQVRSLSYPTLRTNTSRGRGAGGRPSLTTNPWDVDPFAVTDSEAISRSNAGKATADIYHKVIAAQGSQGPLVHPASGAARHLFGMGCTAVHGVLVA